jgi:uncharacterized protein YxeA
MKKIIIVLIIIVFNLLIIASGVALLSKVNIKLNNALDPKASSQELVYYLDTSNFRFKLINTSDSIELQIIQGNTISSIPLFNFSQVTLDTFFREWHKSNSDEYILPQEETCRYLKIVIDQKLAERFKDIGDFDINMPVTQDISVAKRFECIGNNEYFENLI